MIVAIVVPLLDAVALAEGDAVAQTAAEKSDRTRQADSSDDQRSATADPARRWRVELKRQNTDRGTPGETTETLVRTELFPDGAISMWRLDLPFPDARTDFAGKPYDPHLGDIKVRARARTFEARGLPLSAYVELTFPTANPEDLGQGKYQVTPGIETYILLHSYRLKSSTHKLSFEPLVEQDVSVAGDDNFKNINYTKFELPLRDAWRNYSLKLTLKPVIDWEQDGATGAVLELEGQMGFARDWAAKLMLGHRVWGGSTIPSTYGSRIELSVAYRF